MSDSTSAAYAISGHSLIAGQVFANEGAQFYGYDPSSGGELQPVFFSATAEDVQHAVAAAVEASAALAATSGRERGRLLRSRSEERRVGKECC